MLHIDSTDIDRLLEIAANNEKQKGVFKSMLCDSEPVTAESCLLITLKDKRTVLLRGVTMEQLFNFHSFKKDNSMKVLVNGVFIKDLTPQKQYTQTQERGGLDATEAAPPITKEDVNNVVNLTFTLIDLVKVFVSIVKSWFKKK